MAGAVMTSIVLKSGVTLMDIVSTRMLGQFGFLGKVSPPAACPRSRPQVQGWGLLPAEVFVWGCLTAKPETGSTAAMLHLACMPASAGRRKARQCVLLSGPDLLLRLGLAWQRVRCPRTSCLHSQCLS